MLYIFHTLGFHGFPGAKCGIFLWDLTMDTTGTPGHIAERDARGYINEERLSGYAVFRLA